MIGNIENISSKFSVKIQFEEDVPKLYKMFSQNTQYYECMKSPVTYDSIKNDLCALPKNKDFADKRYIGLFKGEELVAVMDLIFRYPDEKTVFIGFFMVNRGYQGENLGTEILADSLKCFIAWGFTHVRLGYVEKNKQAGNFWAKNGFLPIDIRIEHENYAVIILEKKLQ